MAGAVASACRVVFAGGVGGVVNAALLALSSLSAAKELLFLCDATEERTKAKVRGSSPSSLHVIGPTEVGPFPLNDSTVVVSQAKSRSFAALRMTKLREGTVASEGGGNEWPTNGRQQLSGGKQPSSLLRCQGWGLCKLWARSITHLGNSGAP